MFLRCRRLLADVHWTNGNLGKIEAEMKSTIFVDDGPKILLAGLLAPIVFGIFSGILFGDFSAGAGFGAFFMVGTWIFLLVLIVLETGGNNQ